MLYPRMKQAIADQFGGAVLPLGYLPVMKDCTLESRHLGLITAQEMTDLQEKLEALADQIEKSVESRRSGGLCAGAQLGAGGAAGRGTGPAHCRGEGQCLLLLL